MTEIQRRLSDSLSSGVETGAVLLDMERECGGYKSLAVPCFSVCLTALRAHPTCPVTLYDAMVPLQTLIEHLPAFSFNELGELCSILINAARTLVQEPHNWDVVTSILDTLTHYVLERAVVWTGSTGDEPASEPMACALYLLNTGICPCVQSVLDAAALERQFITSANRYPASLRPFSTGSPGYTIADGIIPGIEASCDSEWVDTSVSTPAADSGTIPSATQVNWEVPDTQKTTCHPILSDKSMCGEVGAWVATGKSVKQEGGGRDADGDLRMVSTAGTDDPALHLPCVSLDQTAGNVLPVKCGSKRARESNADAMGAGPTTVNWWCGGSVLASSAGPFKQALSPTKQHPALAKKVAIKTDILSTLHSVSARLAASSVPLDKYNAAEMSYQVNTVFSNIRRLLDRTRGDKRGVKRKAEKQEKGRKTVTEKKPFEDPSKVMARRELWRVSEAALKLLHSIVHESSCSHLFDAGILSALATQAKRHPEHEVWLSRFTRMLLARGSAIDGGTLRLGFLPLLHHVLAMPNHIRTGEDLNSVPAYIPDLHLALLKVLKSMKYSSQETQLVGNIAKLLFFMAVVEAANADALQPVRDQMRFSKFVGESERIIWHKTTLNREGRLISLSDLYTEGTNSEGQKVVSLTYQDEDVTAMRTELYYIGQRLDAFFRIHAQKIPARPRYKRRPKRNSQLAQQTRAEVKSILSEVDGAPLWL
ncbi:hypothetical protein KIPB_001002 [Kipferlia bialata]|uniref:Uncharacterized protein n=1 Tax=Kipferlia bialata TaxID=797122 RepID=A0A9K3CPG0_9EUKA|nr:hypothetical protein KIPB_001002 [Kipferlia bialata]|eukprot:g1002.t1